MCGIMLLDDESSRRDEEKKCDKPFNYYRLDKHIQI